MRRPRLLIALGLVGGLILGGALAVSFHDTSALVVRNLGSEPLTVRVTIGRDVLETRTAGHGRTLRLFRVKSEGDVVAEVACGPGGGTKVSPPSGYVSPGMGSFIEVEVAGCAVPKIDVAPGY